MMLMIVVVLYAAILPLSCISYFTEKAQYTVIAQANIIPLLFATRWNFNISQIEAVQMFFNIPFFRIFKLFAMLIPYIGIFILVVTNIYLKGMNSLDIPHIIIATINLFFYLSLVNLS